MRFLQKCMRKLEYTNKTNRISNLKFKMSINNSKKFQNIFKFMTCLENDTVNILNSERKHE